MASTGSALFLHGGAAIDGTMHGDTWQWAMRRMEEVAGNWTGPRIQHAMAFDTNQSRLVLFGGQDAHRTFADTWEAPTKEPGLPP